MYPHFACPPTVERNGLLFSVFHINPHIKQNLIFVSVYMLMDAHALSNSLSFFLSLSLTHTTQVLVLGAWWRVCLAGSANASLCKVDYIRLNTKIEIFCSVFKSVMSIPNTDLTEIEMCSLIMSQHARGGDAGDCGSRAKCATGKGTLFC
jgi:hypothetical protein